MIEHADLIRAALEGKDIQYETEDGTWEDYVNVSPEAAREYAIVEMIKYPFRAYRIKPVNTVHWIGVRYSSDGKQYLSIPGATKADAVRNTPGDGAAAVLRIELDPEENVVSATSERP